MTKDETLKLTLEALKWSKPHADAEITYNDAIIAIKEALAQPEVFSKQNYLNGYCVGQSDLLAEQAKQAPAAWMVYTQEGQSAFVTDNPTQIHPSQRALPLYATPQWVGFTDEEVNKLVDDEDWYNFPHEFAKAVESKLKEKNT